MREPYANNIRERASTSGLSLIPAWINKEEPELNHFNGTLFYPFSGPDARFPLDFFPHASTYILCGKEATGVMPNLMKYSETDIQEFLQGMLRASDDIARRSFFISSLMKQELNTPWIFGVLPLLLMLLYQNSIRITDFRYVRITRESGLQTTDTPLGKQRNHGAEITFIRDGGGPQQKLLYLCTDLCNHGLKRSGLLQMINVFPQPLAAFVKSAEFALHRPEFSTLRDELLDHFDTLVQDETGLAYRDISESHETKLYGEYGPLPKFPEFYQQDLQTAFKHPRGAIHFKLGYGHYNHLMIARRKP